MQKNTTLSDVYRSRPEQVVQIWKLTGWGNTEDFQMLKHYAKCIMEVPKSISALKGQLGWGEIEMKKTKLRFFFREQQLKKQEKGSNESVEETWLALCVAREEKGEKKLQGVEIFVHELNGETSIKEHSKMIVFSPEHAEPSGTACQETGETFVVVEQFLKIVRNPAAEDGVLACTTLALQRLPAEKKMDNISLRIVVTPTYVRNKIVAEVRGIKRSRPVTPDSVDEDDPDAPSRPPTPVPTYYQDSSDLQ